MPDSALLRLSAGAARTLRGPWTSRALGMTTPSPTMSWMTSTQGRARAVSTSPLLSRCVGSAGCLQGPLQAHFHGGAGGQAGGQTILLGLEAGPREPQSSGPPTPHGSVCEHCLRLPCRLPLPLQGAQTLLSDPGDSTALTSCRHLVTMSRGQWHILDEIIWLTQLGSGGPLPSKQRWPGAGLGSDGKGQMPPPCLGQPGSVAWPWERPAEPCEGREVP